MPLIKGFLQPKLNTNIPKHKYVVGVIVGLLMAFFLYAFQYMAREMIRISSASAEDIWMLSDREVDFYNLIFAFIAVIMGQSVCFEFLFNRPKRIFYSRPGRMQTIINDQRFLNWNFLSWFFRSATMYGLIFCTAGLGDFYIMSLYPDYNYMFVFIVIVLFLQTWNGLLLTFKKKAFKWMLVSAVLISLASFGLSKINIVDYKAFNEKVINSRLDEKYNLRLPQSNYYQPLGYRYMHVPNISLVMAKNEVNYEGPLLFIGKTVFEMSDLADEVKRIKSHQSYELQEWMPVYLQIDESVSMKYVHDLKENLVVADIRFLNYVVIPKKLKFDKRYYSGKNRIVLDSYNQANDFFALQSLSHQDVSNAIQIEITNEEYIINTIKVQKDEMAMVIEKQIVKNLDYGIFLNFKEEVSFGAYMGAISAVSEAIYNLRDKETFKRFGIYFNDFEEEENYNIREEKRSVITKYPRRYIENWKDSGIEGPKRIEREY